jgi:hypothetical protein
VCYFGNLKAQDWSVGLNHRTILSKSSSFSQHGFAIINDQVFTPFGMEFTRELNPKLALKFNAATTKRTVEFSFDRFFEFERPSERDNFNPTVENDIYFFSTALHYEIASYNGFRIRPLMGFSLLVERDQETYQAGIFLSRGFENETGVVEFSQRLINEVNPYFDVGIEVVVPVFKRIDLGISYIHSRPLFGIYYAQNYDFAQLMGLLPDDPNILSTIPQRYVVNERFNDKLIFDALSFSLSYRFR